MLIDGFTVVAQLINFVVLVWLLKRYLYRPVLDAVDTREKLIAAQLSEAETQKAAAQQQRRQLELQHEQFAEQRESLLRTATEEVERERLKMLADARREAEALRTGFAAKLAGDRLAWEREMAVRIQHEVFAISHRLLQDLADTSLEAQIVRMLLKKAQGLSGEEKLSLNGSVQQRTTPVLVRSRYELSAQSREQIQSLVAAVDQPERALRFDTDPDLICGIEVFTNGHKLSWSIADYLAQSEAAVQQTLSPSITDSNRHVAATAK